MVIETAPLTLMILVKRRWRIVLVTLLFVACAMLSPSAIKYARRLGLKHEGETIILKIEAYRGEKHELPSTLEEIGINEEKIFYHQIGETNYWLSFDEEFGEFVRYDSSKRAWNR